ncbi:uncharacterized protein [Miscanthus floridulus]|uniref:uncharacterized protein n=1 Tax=Miscanthus floridulus TaxID=154761 RepID=UPI003458A7C4
MGWGPLDHLPDIGETGPGASASSSVLLGGGGGAVLGLAIACPEAKADTPEAQALGKRAVSPVGLTAVVEQVVAGATQLPPQRTEGAPGSVEDRPAPANTEVVPLPPPPPLQMRVAVPNRLQPRSSRKRPAEVPTLAPLKALKVNPGSTAHWVAEAQAAIQHGAVSARADPKEPATQGGAGEATPTQTGEGAPSPREGEAHESDGAEVPSVAEASEVEAPRVTEARATEARAPETAEAAAVGVGVSATTEATMAEAGAPETTEADVTVARPSAQEVEMKAVEPSVAPLVQGPPSLRESAREVEVHPISSDDTSRAQEVVDAEVADAVEQPVLTLGEGSSALVWVRPEPRGWDHPRVLWQSRYDPEGEPLFALKDVAEGGRWDTFEQYRELAEQSLRTVLSVVADDLPGVTQDQLQRQKGLLADTNELLAARSAEVEDLRLRCADAKVKAATAQEQVTPLAARVKELEEELTRVTGDRNAFRSRAEEAMASGKVLTGQLGVEQKLGREASRVAEATRVEAQHLKEKAEASRAEAQCWKEKVEAFVAVQAVLETEIKEHDALKGAAHTACKALEVEGVQSGNSLGSRLIALSGQVHERLRGALHTSVKRVLAIIASHYIGVDLQAISDGYVLPDDEEEADEVVAKLIEAAKGPGTALAKLFEEELSEE